MNKKIADQLWLILNKVRGIIEISDLCKFLICAFFLKYVEIKYREDKWGCAECVYDEKFSVGYLSLTYGKMINKFDLVNYVTRLERGFNIEENVISDELGRLLDKVDEKISKLIFGEVDKICFESSGQMYEVALRILNKLSSTNGKTTGAYFTNVSISKLEKSLLDCKEDMLVYDGFCGCGVSANEVANHKGIVFLQDINVSILAIASVMTILKGNRIGKIRCGDSLLNPIVDRTYDRIVAEPPFMPKYGEDYLLSIPQNNCVYSDILNSDSIALRHVISHLKDDGMAAVLVPMGTLFKSGRMAEIRKILIENHIDTVIELPTGVWPNTLISTALLILKKHKDTNSIYMINAKEYFEKVDKSQNIINDENIIKIVELFHTKEDKEAISYNAPVEEIAANGFNLCTTQYVTRNIKDTIIIEDNKNYLKKYDDLVKRLAQIDKQLENLRSRLMKDQ